MDMNLEVMINKLEHKVNELLIKNQELKKLGAIKGSLGATYRCELRKELARLPLDNIKVSTIGDIENSNAKIVQLRINRDLAKIRYYSMKSSVEKISLEIEYLRSILTWITGEFGCLNVNKKRYQWLN